MTQSRGSNLFDVIMKLADTVAEAKALLSLAAPDAKKTRKAKS